MTHIHHASGKVLLRGAKPSRRTALAMATPHKTRATPTEYSDLPMLGDMWNNDADGCCVSSEEAAEKSTAAGGAVHLTDENLKTWATKNGFENGAELATVLDQMARNAGNDGIPQSGVIYGDGGKQGVDYTNWNNLTSAISQGMVKIAIDADALPNEAGNSNGWMILSCSTMTNYDHCVGLASYGSLAYCCGILKVAVPSGADPTTPCVILYTWSTVGIVAFSALVNFTCEAWVRSPNTVTVPPSPTPTPTPTPTPNWLEQLILSIAGAIPTVGPFLVTLLTWLFSLSMPVPMADRRFLLLTVQLFVAAHGLDLTFNQVEQIVEAIIAFVASGDWTNVMAWITLIQTIVAILNPPALKKHMAGKVFI